MEPANPTPGIIARGSDTREDEDLDRAADERERAALERLDADLEQKLERFLGPRPTLVEWLAEASARRDWCVATDTNDLDELRVTARLGSRVRDDVLAIVFGSVYRGETRLEQLAHRAWWRWLASLDEDEVRDRLSVALDEGPVVETRAQAAFELVRTLAHETVRPERPYEEVPGSRVGLVALLAANVEAVADAGRVTRWHGEFFNLWTNDADFLLELERAIGKENHETYLALQRAATRGPGYFCAEHLADVNDAAFELEREEVKAYRTLAIFRDRDDEDLEELVEGATPLPRAAFVEAARATLRESGCDDFELPAPPANVDELDPLAAASLGHLNAERIVLELTEKVAGAAPPKAPPAPPVEETLDELHARIFRSAASAAATYDPVVPARDPALTTREAVVEAATRAAREALAPKAPSNPAGNSDASSTVNDEHRAREGADAETPRGAQTDDAPASEERAKRRAGRVRLRVVAPAPTGRNNKQGYLVAVEGEDPRRLGRRRVEALEARLDALAKGRSSSGRVRENARLALEDLGLERLEDIEAIDWIPGVRYGSGRIERIDNLTDKLDKNPREIRSHKAANE